LKCSFLVYIKQGGGEVDIIQCRPKIKVKETSPFFICTIFIDMNIESIIRRVLVEEFLNENEFLYEDIYGSVEDVNLLFEAEYQGRKVQLGKIMQGDIKKFKVYVKNDKGKVVKVNFGFGGKSAKGKRMVIKKNNPERRRSFRARHNCDNPGPRWKPRYWACRTW
jgi:hypothetical protein